MAPDNRYRSLDHWRGFAALWVMIFHAFNLWVIAQPELLPAWLGNFVTNGWLGVHVFFVISGYCITERVAREFHAGGSVSRYFSDRLLRIYPPYWAALALVFVLNLASALVKQEALNHPGILPSGWEWPTVSLAVAHWLGQPSYLLVAWTLAYEIGFYALAAIGLLFARLSGRPWLGFAWGLGLMILGLIPRIGLWLPILTFWTHFALGGLVWLLQHRVVTFRIRLPLGSSLIGLVCVGSWLTGNGLNRQFLMACGCAWLLLALHPWDGRIARLKLLRWLGWVGVFSYSLYLVHAPLIGRTHNLLTRWRSPADTTILCLQAACCLLTVAFAWLFYRLVEAKSETVRRRLIPRSIISRS